jgi:hypothetical protein
MFEEVDGYFLELARALTSGLEAAAYREPDALGSARR